MCGACGRGTHPSHPMGGVPFVAHMVHHQRAQSNRQNPSQDVAGGVGLQERPPPHTQEGEPADLAQDSTPREEWEGGGRLPHPSTRIPPALLYETLLYMCKTDSHMHNEDAVNSIRFPAVSFLCRHSGSQVMAAHIPPPCFLPSVFHSTSFK